MNNRYGLDARYFEEQLGLISQAANNYTPEEMYRALSRLAAVAHKPSKNSKLLSHIESTCNIATGFFLAWFTWTLLRLGPFAWGWLTIEDGFLITCVFTVVSYIRSYYWRRFFATELHEVLVTWLRNLRT